MSRDNKSLIDFDDSMKLLKSLLKYWYLLIGVPIIALLIAFLYTHKLQRNYSVSTQLLLKSNDVYNYQSGLLRGLNGGYNAYQSYEETANQIRVLKSNLLIQNTISRLDLAVSYFIDGRLKTTELYKQSPFRVESPNLDKALSNVLFRLNFVDDSTFILSYSINGEDRSFKAKFGEFLTKDALYFSILPNRNGDFHFHTLHDIDYSFRINSNSALVNRFKGRLAAQNLEYSTVIELSLSDNIIDRARDFLDTLTHEYIEYTLFNERRVNENTLYYIDLQLEKVVDNISTIEKELELFKDQKAILDLSKEQEIQFDILKNKDAELEKLKYRLESIKQLESFMLSSKDEIAFPPTGLLLDDDEFLKRKFEEWYNTKIQLDDFNTQFQPDNLAVIEKNRESKSLFETLLQYVASTNISIQKQIKELQSSILSVENGLRQIPRNEKELLGITRKLAGYESLYSMLVSRRAETEIAKAAIIPETKVIESAHPDGKIEPNVNQIRKNAVLIAFIIAVALVLIRIMFFETLKNSMELSRETEISILGEVPKLNLPNTGKETIDDNDRGQFANSFRVLRANMQFFSAASEAAGRVIMVTSILPGEGKTFITANLARVTAMSGRKVAVVDLDLHKPRLHKIFKIPNQTGVSSYIIGNQNMDEVKVVMDEFLHVFTAGPMPPNPSEMIFRAELTELLNRLKADYDFVFIDTPPVGPISDSLVLSEFSDMNIFVLNTKYATKQNIRYFNQLLDKNPVKNATVIMNGVVAIKRSKYGKYGYGYGNYYGSKYYHYGE